MRSYHLKFYVPMLLLWGSVILSAANPVLIQSDIRFDDRIERNDLLRIEPGGNVALDDLIVYRLNRVDYISRVIGLSGDEILLGLDGNSILRNGERVVLAPRGSQISMREPQAAAVEPGQAAIYVASARRNPVILVIGEADIRGPIDKVYRYASLDRADWLTIGFSSLLVVTLMLLPYLAFVRQPAQNLLRLTILVTHTFLILAVAATLFAASLPGDPMRLGAADPIWWWFPLAVVAGFDRQLVLVVAVFLGAEWLLARRPWQRSGHRGDPSLE